MRSRSSSFAVISRNGSAPLYVSVLGDDEHQLGSGSANVDLDVA
jgi:hypothetical protein